MNSIDKFVAPDWDHDDGAHRVEAACVFDPRICEKLGEIAQAFITSQGLTAEFDEIVEQAEVFLAVNPKKGDEFLEDDQRRTRYALRFIQMKGFSDAFANTVETYEPSAQAEAPAPVSALDDASPS